MACYLASIGEPILKAVSYAHLVKFHMVKPMDPDSRLSTNAHIFFRFIPELMALYMPIDNDTTLVTFSISNMLF